MKTLNEYLLLKELSSLGFSKSEAEPLSDGEEHFSGETYWFYDGPLDEMTRSFCASLLKLDRYWSQSDIDFLSRKVGYDVFSYAAGFNCRHQWKVARIKGRVKRGYMPKTPTRGQVDRSAVRQPSAVQDYFPR